MRSKPSIITLFLSRLRVQNAESIQVADYGQSIDTNANDPIPHILTTLRIHAVAPMVEVALVVACWANFCIRIVLAAGTGGAAGAAAETEVEIEMAGARAKAGISTGIITIIMGMGVVAAAEVGMSTNGTKQRP